MTCFHPMSAFKPRGGGSIIFADRGDCDPITISCKQCIGCRLRRSRDWAMRCMHEASLYESNSFLTLTYDEAHLPAQGQLVYRDFVLFMKRLRRFAEPVELRFYMCGEYGSENWRPHFHACIFGFDFDDKAYYGRSGSGDKLYTSDSLSRLWPHGLSTIGSVTFESAGYVARYCVSKRTGKAAEAWYARVDDSGESFQLKPEFNQMSRDPGLGAPWLEKFGMDVFPHDYVIVNGTKVTPPAFYDRWFGIKDPDGLDDIKFRRELDAALNFEDNSDARLAVKESVQRAAVSQLYRSV